LKPSRSAPVVLAAALVFILCGAPVQAQVNGEPAEAPEAKTSAGRSWEKLRISLGGFIKRFDGRIRLDSVDGDIGTEIKVEDDLGVDRDNFDLRIFGNYRLGKRSGLTLGYYQWNRSTSHVIEEEVHWGEEIFEVGARVDFGSGTRVLQVSYEYSVLKREKWDLVLSAGLSIFSFDFKLAAEGEINDSGAGTFDNFSQATDLVAPVPAFGLQLRYTFRPGLEAALRGVFFALQTDTWGGQMVDVAMIVDWFPWKHVGFGAGFNSVRLDYDSNKKGRLKVDYDYKGVLVYVTLVY